MWGLCWVLNPLYSPSAHHRAATGPQTSSLQACVLLMSKSHVCVWVAVCLHTGVGQKRVHHSWVFELSILCTVLSVHMWVGKWVRQPRSVCWGEGRSRGGGLHSSFLSPGLLRLSFGLPALSWDQAVLAAQEPVAPIALEGPRPSLFLRGGSRRKKQVDVLHIY